jgi:hypothetical protein
MGKKSMVDFLGAFCDVCVPVIMVSRKFSAVGKLTIQGHTNGSPQYVHVLISGLSTLMKILGWPRGPPPPSQDTTRLSTHRTGCL